MFIFIVNYLIAVCFKET